MAEADQENKSYCKGDNPELDKKFADYKKVNVFAGLAVDKALTDNEGDILVELWLKERTTPRKLYVHEVLTLVKFSEIILEWRRKKKREKTRIRKERERRKLRDEAKKGIEKAEMKLQLIKKADRLKAEKYRKLQRKMRVKSKKVDPEGESRGV